MLTFIETELRYNYPENATLAKALLWKNKKNYGH
jgi:hypothetical protein